MTKLLTQHPAPWESARDGERRTRFRHSKIISLRYRDSDHSAGTGYATTKDVGRAGLKFLSDGFLRPGLRVCVQLELGSSELEVRDAHVVWANKVRHGDSYWVGIVFNALSLDQYRSIVAFRKDSQ